MSLYDQPVAVESFASSFGLFIKLGSFRLLGLCLKYCHLQLHGWTKILSILNEVTSQKDEYSMISLSVIYKLYK